MRRPRTAVADHAAQWRDPPESGVGLEDAVALHATIDLGAHPELVEQMHLEPARHAARGHSRIEQLVRPPQERVQRFGGMTLLEAPIRELGQVPRGRCAFEVVPQMEPGVPDTDLRHHVERAPPCERHGELREWLETAADTRRGPADALGDRLELAARRRDQGQDPVRLAEIEPRQHDGIGGVATGDGHLRSDGTIG